LLPPESLFNGVMSWQDKVDAVVVGSCDGVAGRETYNRDLPAGKLKGVRRPNFQRNLFILAIRNKN